MNSQNIFSYFGVNLDVRLDSSEYYDYDMSVDYGDYYINILDFTKEIQYDSLAFDSNCLLTGTTIDAEKPLVLEIGVEFTGGTCSYIPQRRTEKGWTLDMVFDRNGLDWISGGTFYFLGVTGETNEYFYLDNNLSFSFSSGGTIDVEAYRYSGYCETLSGWSELGFVDKQSSPVLCTNGTSNDFDITITFERYNYYLECDLENEGGINDLITGWTVVNPWDVLTGATEEVDLASVLNFKWEAEEYKRYGTLRIFLNGNPILKVENWEEVIPSDRFIPTYVSVSGDTDTSCDPPIEHIDMTAEVIYSGITNQYQIFGGGTTGSSDLHLQDTAFEIKSVKFFNEPLHPLNVKHHYITSIKSNFNITECQDDCIETPVGII